MPPTTIKSTFVGTAWHEEDLKATRTLPNKVKVARDERRFDSDDMRGWAVASYTITHHDKSENCTFSGHQVFDGTLLGRKGSFSLAAAGTYFEGKHLKATWTVIPETASGELRGLTGTGWYWMDMSAAPPAAEGATGEAEAGNGVNGKEGDKSEGDKGEGDKSKGDKSKGDKGCEDKQNKGKDEGGKEGDKETETKGENKEAGTKGEDKEAKGSKGNGEAGVVPSTTESPPVVFELTVELPVTPAKRKAETDEAAGAPSKIPAA